MNLKRIELKGFKSFADRTGIDFLDGVTCIVGPNGCGKSNITDSIRWVLGEQKTNQLRAKKMEDVIFNGTENRDAQNYAEVNLIFDNAEAFFAQGLKEMSLKRVLHRSGESSYYINGQSVRLKDVRELLMDSGIGVSGYSLISQGDIEDILRDNKFNRRRIFEEASGISLFHHKKEESERRLLRVKDNLMRLGDIFHEVDSRREPLREAADKAASYIALRDQLKRLELYFGLSDYDRYKQELETLEREVKKLRAELEAVSELRVQRLAQKEALQQQLNGREEEETALRGRLQLKLSERDELGVQIRLIEEKKSQQHQRLNEMKHTLEAHRERITQAKKETARIEEALCNVKVRFTEKSEHLQELETKLQEMRTELHLSGKSKEELAEHIRNLRFEQERLKNTLDMYEEQRLEKEKIAKTLKQEALELKIEKRIVEDKVLALRDRLDQLQQALNEHEQMQKRRIDAISSSQAARDLLRKNVLELRLQQHMTEEKLSILENLSDDQTTQSIAFLAKAGIRFNGQLIDHLKITAGYEKAIEAALGRAFYNQLLESEDEIADLLDLVQKHQLPQLGFIVPARIKDRQVTHKRDGVIGVAADFIEGSSLSVQVAKKLLGRTLVVKDMATALHLKAEEEIVTVDGETLKPSGSIYTAKGDAHILKQLGERQELADQLDAFVQAHEQALAELAEIEQALEQQQDEWDQVQNEPREKLEVMHQLRQELQTIEQNKAVFLFQERQLQESIEANKHQVEDFEKRKDNALQRLRELNQEEQNARKEQEPVQSNGQKLAYDELLNQQLELRILHARIEEEENQLQENLQRAMRHLNSEQSDFIDLEKQQDLYIRTERDLVHQADELTEKHATLKLEIHTQDEHIAKLHEMVLSLKAGIKELDHLLYTDESGLDAKREGLMQKEILFTRSEERQNAISDELWNKYEMSILQIRDYLANQVIEGNRTTMKNLRMEMMAMEPVHLGAIDEYKDILERHTFLEKQIEDLKASERDIQKTIKNLEVRMKEDFLRTFEEIRTHYHNIFTELFQGGRGDIDLENPEDVLESDILIFASPPGKKLQHMNLLSGGEKALTAIALLFSVLRAKPAPFYVLDEIEAALDDINIQRFGRFLEQFSKGSQFILITHRKGTMEFAKALYGVSMEEKGVSKTVSLQLQ